MKSGARVMVGTRTGVVTHSKRRGGLTLVRVWDGVRPASWFRVDDVTELGTSQQELEEQLPPPGFLRIRDTSQ